MKKEATKKSKLWLWLVIGLVALVAVAGVVLALVLGGEKAPAGPVGGRPDLYWNVDKVTYTKDSESGLSTREPGEDGTYRVRFAYNGQQVELPIVDKQLVNYIDTMEVMGLVMDADGVVVDVIAPEDFTTPVALNAYVQQVMSDKIIANSSIAMNGMQYTIELNELTEIYNVSDTAAVSGELIQASDFQPMDSLWVYANDMEQVTHIYMTEHPDTSPIYWRAEQHWSSSEKATSRVPDENGVYSIEFCSDGGLVTLKCKDKSIVSSIDNKSPHSCHFGFLFDDEGYIIDIMNSGIGIRGAVAAERIEVTELDGRYFSGTQLIPSDSGLSYSATLPESCVIYDASSGARRNGVQGQAVENLQLGDRICVWTDPAGTPVVVYIANRLQNVPAYYNLERKYDATKKETTREPDYTGLYPFEVVETGKTGKITVRATKELANLIDSRADRVVGLRVENGIVKSVYDPDDIFGWSTVYGGYVPTIQGSIVSVVSFSKPDSPTNILMGVDYKCYDVSGKDVPYGTETTLRVGDMTTICRDVSYNGVVVYITRRLVGADKVYYNIDRKYDSTNKVTLREPDEEGYYVFTMAHNGKQVQVKTKDKELANKVEASPYGDLIDVMRVENGIIKELYDTQAAYGNVIRSGYRVGAINGDGTITVYASSGTEYTVKVAEDVIIYNVSSVYDSHKGERIYSLRVGDMISSLGDYRGEAKMIWVRQRGVDDMFVNKDRKYNASDKVTLREPDADGYYWFELASNGTLKWYKTKDAALATQIDAYSTPFGLRVKGDEILNVTAPNYVKGVSKAGDNGWDVVSVSGSNVKLTFTKPGYKDTGTTKTITVGSNVKIYDISPSAEKFGAVCKLQKGDRIRTYTDKDGNAVYVFVLFRETRVKGTTGYCEHCKKEVLWQPWAGASWDGVDCHYYLSADIEITTQTNVGNTSKDYEVVLDLNGKKLRVNGARAFLSYRGDTLSILDSVGGGEFAATGLVGGGNGGTVLLSGEGSTFNLYGGTMSFIDSDMRISKGACIYMSTGATFNMYGGTIKGGIVNTPDVHAQGGNVFMYGGTFNMYGGTIADGRAERIYLESDDLAAQGGNIYAYKNAVINMYGGTIQNGFSNQHGGNLFLSTATLNLYDGKIIGGECVYSGGNMYSQFAAIFNIAGGEINSGKAGAMGNNLYASHDTNELHISGGVITGDLQPGKAKTISISGAPKISVGEKAGLAIPSNVILEVGELTKGAEVYVNANGAFTTENEKAQAFVDAGYVKPAAERTTIVVENDVMIMEGELAYCEHCGTSVEWKEWTGSTPASGHYFIGKDFKQSSQISIAAGTDVVLDLYGHTYTSKDIRNFLVRGQLSVMDSVGGGKMLTTGGPEFAGSIAMIAPASGQTEPASFSLYSGTLELAADHPSFANGGLLNASGCTVNIYGGTMIGGNVTQRGGCIITRTTSTVVNIYGGLITGGTADIAGGCIYSVGKLNIQGGVIEGQVFIDSGSNKSLVIAGAPTIEELNVVAGQLVDISGLTTGAQIGVIADGVFTKDMEKPGDMLQYLTSIDPYMDIKISGAALEMAIGQAMIDKLNNIHTQAEQMTADGVFNAGGTVTAYCPVCESEAQWIDLNTVATGTKVTEGTHFYLSADMNVDTHYSFYTNACVHLNGHNITSPARAFYVEASYDSTAGYTVYTLNLMGEGVVTGAGYTHTSVPRGVLDLGGSANIFGGTYVSTSGFPAITARGFNGKSVTNIYEGTTVKGERSMLIRSNGVNIYGGDFDGQIYVDGAAANSLSVYGGEFKNTYGTEAVYAHGAKATVYLAGGNFTDKIYVAADLGDLLISEAPKIAELDLTSGAIAKFQSLTADAKIGINANGAFSEPNPDAKAFLDAGNIVVAKTGTTIYEQDNVLYMEKQKSYCQHCQQEVVWTEWAGHTSPVTGHYVVTDTFTQEKQLSIVADTEVVLDLNGNQYNIVGVRGFLVRGDFSIIDSVGGGKITTTGNTTENAHGGFAYVQNASNDITGACLNLYSGTVEMAQEHTVTNRGGLIQITTGGVMNIYGGAVVGGETSEYGGNISVGSANAVLNMYGGEISGGVAPAGGDVYVIGTFNMNGGEIKGDVAVDIAATEVKLENAAKIAKLTVAEGKLINVSGLTAGATIGIKATGIFTEKLTNADSYLTYFTKLFVDDEFYVADNAIGMETVNELDRLNGVHTKAEKMTADGVFAAGGTVTAVCPVCGTEQQWVPLNPNGEQTVTEEGHYYLSEDVIKEYTSTKPATVYSFNADACLHLNGKTINTNKRAIYVEAPSKTEAFTLNIMGEGNIYGYGQSHATANRGGALDIGGNLNLFGGTYHHSNDMPILSCRGWGVQNVVNIYDGTQICGDASFNTPSVMVRTHTLNIYGGLITGGNGGNIHLNGTGAGELNIYGGTIENGVATKGANILATGTKSNLTIAGGAIIGGDVYVESGFKSVTVTGKPVIENLDLTSGKKLAIGELEFGADIGITANGVFTDALTGADAYLAYIWAANDENEVVVENNALAVRESAVGKKNKVHEAAEKMTADGVFSGGGDITALCPVCETEVVWKELNAFIAAQGSTTLPAAGHFYLGNDMTLEKHISTKFNMCLHLNGHNITSSARVLYAEYVTVNIMGEGLVTGAGTAANRGVIDVPANVNFYGGTYTATNAFPVVAGRSNNDHVINIYEGASFVRTAENPGINIWIYDHQDLNIYGGLISGGSNVGGNGANIIMESSKTAGRDVKCNIYGGTIEKGTAAVGSNIYSAGKTCTVNIAGGNIVEGEIYLTSAVNGFRVSGAVVIDCINTAGGELLNVGALRNGAQITVSGANGAFTPENATAAAYVDFFKAADSAKVVKAENNTLVLADA